MRRLGTFTAVFMLAMVGLVPTSVADAGGGPPPDYFVDQSKLPFEAAPGATAYWGVHKGAGYRIEVPDNWNGDLVMWAHGFRGTGLELTVEDHPLRSLLIPLGYAWASSSYSRNDYDISVGVKDTHALAKRFSGIVGNADKVYISGASMGGHITAVSIEQYNTYAGALAVCGVVGDHELFDYFTDFSLAGQQLGTGSSTFPVDPAQYIGVTVPTIKANMEAVPGTFPFVLNATGESFKQLVEIQSGGDRPNFDEAFAFWNSIDGNTGPGNFLFEFGAGDGTLPRAPGVAVDNSDTVYQLDLDPAISAAEQALNDDIFRVSADAQTRRTQGLAQVPTITGDISVPMLTLHNLGDLFVPVHNEIVYGERVAAQGNSDLLVQRAIRGVVHCDFTPAELGTAFLDLVTWVEAGVKPDGDDFLDSMAVADPLFGCEFTDGFHFLGTPCP